MASFSGEPVEYISIDESHTWTTLYRGQLNGRAETSVVYPVSAPSPMCTLVFLGDDVETVVDRALLPVTPTGI